MSTSTTLHHPLQLTGRIAKEEEKKKTIAKRVEKEETEKEEAGEGREDREEWAEEEEAE